MLSTYLTDKFNILTQRLTRVGSSLENVTNPESGFINGVLFGGLVGIIWTPCAGPILAAVIVQVVIQQTTIFSLFTILFFAIGAALPMLIIAFVGREVLEHAKFIRQHTVLFRKLLGLIIIMSVIFLFFTGGAVPSISPSTSVSSEKISSSSEGLALVNGLLNPYKAPEITGIEAWINTPPLNTSQLKNKVVLIDFWTYSCINCIRTLPYLKSWYAQYHNLGFTIIGVHSPEFQFEHDLNNVKNAVMKFGILYPVALDNQFSTWRNYHNQYWPAHYLINKDGYIVYQSFGEGEYDITENNIRYLLGLHGAAKGIPSEQSFSIEQTPETYFGYARAKNFTSPEKVGQNSISLYSYPNSLNKNEWALQGEWIINSDKIVAASVGASIKINFVASHVYAVMGAPKKIKLKIRFNSAKQPSKDVFNKEITVSTQQLYPLLNFPNPTAGTLEIISESPGLELYTFTFG